MPMRWRGDRRGGGRSRLDGASASIHAATVVWVFMPVLKGE